MCIAKVHAAGTARSCWVIHAHVVLSALVGIGEDVVSLVDFLEHLICLLAFFLAALVTIGMPFECQLLECLFNLVISRFLINTEDGVVVFIGCLLLRFLNLLIILEGSGF